MHSLSLSGRPPVFSPACETLAISQMARVWEETRARAIWKSIHFLPETLTNKPTPAGT
jgi:hypothetical protein